MTKKIEVPVEWVEHVISHHINARWCEYCKTNIRDKEHKNWCVAAKMFNLLNGYGEVPDD